MALATRYDVTLFANAPLLAREYLEDQPGRYDALYLPRATYHTGDLHTHDVVFQAGDVLLVNTRFSLPGENEPASSTSLPVWRPKFVSDLVPEDRCHLNGVALVEGRPKYVTALGTTDEPGGWRENKASGGVVIDVETDEIVLSGLAMPHSPRWYEGRLWAVELGDGRVVGAWSRPRGRHRGGVRFAGLLAGAVFCGALRAGGAVQDPRETHFRRFADPEALRETALRRGGGRSPQRRGAGDVRVHRRVRGALRRTIPAWRPPADDPQSGQAGGAPGDDQSRLLLLAPAECGDCRWGAPGVQGSARTSRRVASSRHPAGGF